MTTIEHTPEGVQPGSERPVFLAKSGRRARILGIAAKFAFVITVLWLAALAAGMLGFGRLPGTSIEQPFNRLISGGGDASKNQPPSADSGSASVTASARERSARAQAIAARRSTFLGTSARRPRSPRRPAAAQPTQPARPAAGQAAVAQQPRQQGWTRQGHVAPPGQVRKAQPPAPVPTQPGKGLGRVKKTAPITPPPPPPPPGNGNGNGGSKLK